MPHKLLKSKKKQKINAGEIRFVIGPNGAGKSTFFKLVVGYHSPNSGTITYKGKNIEKLKLHERINLGMGVKFQAPSVFSELTVLENLSLANNRENSLNINDLLTDFDLKNTVDNKLNFRCSIFLNRRFIAQKATRLAPQDD